MPMKRESPAPASRKPEKTRGAERPGSSPGESFLGPYAPFAWILLAGILLYARTVFFKFSYLDDQELIVNAFNFISHPSNIPHFFKEDVFHSASGGAYYRPMLTISFMTDALWGGAGPGAYHFTNMLLHLFACCLLYRTLGKLGQKKGPSLFYSLFFAVHPVLAQAVAWIPGRNDSLLAVFTLLSFISFLSFLEDRRPAGLAAHLLFLLLALLTKENAVLLCPLCLFYLIFMNGKEPASRPGAPLFAGWTAVVLSWLLARNAVLKAALAGGGYDIPGSLAGNSPALISYLGKIVFPFNLGTFPALKDLPLSYGAAAAAATLILLSASRTKRAGFAAFGALWFFSFLAPSLIQARGIVPNFSEHRLYLPLMGFVFLLAELDIPGTLRLSRRAGAALGMCVLLFLGIIDISYCGSFSDKIHFWKKAVESSPSRAFNWNNMGAMYYLDGDLPKAESAWKRAVLIDPSEPRVNCNLGLLYMDRGEIKEALRYFLEEIRIDPRYDKVYFNLGLLYYRSGSADKAADAWETALRLNPDYSKVYICLARLYRGKDSEKARSYIERMRKRGLTAPDGEQRGRAAFRSLP